jgi:hypothetical protein
MGISEGKLDLIDNRYLIKAELKLKILKMKKVKELIYFYQNGIDHSQKYLENWIQMFNINKECSLNNGQ